jgi:hypothetical protein
MPLCIQFQQEGTIGWDTLRYKPQTKLMRGSISKNADETQSLWACGRIEG